MKLAKWLVGGALAGCLIFGQNALAQGNSEGHGHGKGHDKHRDDDQGDNNQGYYHGTTRISTTGTGKHGNNLPPGLAKKDRLPPGLEKQLVRRERCHRDCRKRLNLARPNWFATCRLRRPIARTS